MSKKYTEKELKNIAKILANNLRLVSDGTKIDTWHLVKAAGYDMDTFSECDLADIHLKLFEEAEARNITLDMSEHELRLEGLSYNLDYVVRHN